MTWVNEELLRASNVDLRTRKVLADDMVAYKTPGGAPAVQLWHKLSIQASLLGGWPLLYATPDELFRLEESLGERSPIEEVIAALPDAAPVEALKAARAEGRVGILARLKSMGIELPFAQQDATPGQEAFNEAGWPSKPSSVDRLPSTPFDILHPRQPLPACVLIIVRTDDATLAPAMMNFGSFNDCPEPRIHVSFLRDWNRRYGAVPIAITGDVIELSVPRPPQTKRESFAVAREQYAYAPDVVDQGTETVNRLAMELWSAPYWYFWWD